MAEQRYADLWTSAQQRVLDLYDGMDAATAATPVPATPSWSARDLVAHVVGVAADVVAGTTDPEISDAWTQGHVDQRADRSLAEVLHEWRELTPRVLALLPDAEVAVATSLVVDLTTHEQDLRGALARPGARTDPALRLGVRAFGAALGQKVAEGGLPPVRLIGDDAVVEAPRGAEPSATARTTLFELHRAMSGRRSAAQVRGWGWDGDAEPYLPVLSYFGDLRGTDLAE